jgi:hypothetical protein
MYPDLWREFYEEERQKVYDTLAAEGFGPAIYTKNMTIPPEWTEDNDVSA